MIVPSIESTREFNSRVIKDVVNVSDEDELTEEVIQKRLREAVAEIDELTKHYKKALALTEKLEETSKNKNPRAHRRCRWQLRALAARSSASRGGRYPPDRGRGSAS